MNNPASPATPALDPTIFKRLADTSTQAIGMAGLDSRMLYANETLHRMLGISVGASLTNHSFYEFFADADAQRLRDDIIPIVLTNGEWTGEIDLRSLSGNQHHTIQNIFLISDGNDTPIAFASVITDITARVKTELELQIRHAAIDSSLNAIAISNPDGTLSYVNPAFVDLWRLPRAEDALGRSPTEFWERPEDAQAVINTLLLKGRWEGELSARLHDGSLAIMQLSAHLVSDSAGNPVCMMGSFVDITPRKQAEAATLATQNQLEATLDAIPDLLFELGLDGTYYDVHAQRPDLLAAPAKDLLGNTVTDRLPSEAAAIVMSALREAQNKGQSHGKQLELPLPQGSTYFELSVSRKRSTPDEDPRFIVLSRDITTRKHMEQALQHERDFAASLVNTAPVIVLLLDTDGTILHVNPYFEQLTGYDLNDIKGKEWFATCLPARDQERIRALFQNATHDVPTRGNVNAIITRSGDELEIEWNDQAMYDMQGRVTSVLAIGLDVTARRSMEQALRASAERLNAAQRIAQVGSWELDLLSGTLIWSDEIFRLFEIDKDQFGATYAAFLDAIHPDDRAKVNQAYTHSLETRAPYEITHRLRMKDGRTKWVQERCRSDFSAEGTPIRSVGTVQDISELHQAQSALESFKNTLDRTLDAVFIFEPETLQFSYVNQGAVDQLGYHRDELLTLHPYDIKPHFPEPLFRQMVAPMLLGEKDTLRFETLHRTKHGTDIPVEIFFQYVVVNNEIPRFVAIVHDISERKRAQRALASLNEDLEQRVAQRTAELVGARDEAERASRAKSEFLSRMSHELRTPLNAILGFGQLLEMDQLNPEQADNVQEVLRAARHLLELINEVLDLARIEGGRLDIVMEPVALAPLIQDCLALIRPIAQKRNIMTSVISSSCHAVLGDRLRLRQVLLNLLSNAVKYNRVGGYVEIGCQSLPSGQVRVSVRDNGHGIPTDALPRLFRAFERLEASYSGIEGTGIGLAITKRLVEAMNGAIGAESTPEVGSTFWIDLDAAPATTQQASTPAAAAGARAPATTTHTLLYVEDNPINLRLVKKIMAARPHLALLDAPTAELGLDIAAAHLPDIILLDIGLPGMNGFDALQHLKKDPATRHIPVIAITANALPRDIERGKAAGFTDYITKPLDNQQLLDAIDREINLIDARRSDS